MTSEERTLINYRLERAKETLGEAQLLYDNGYLNTYVNRLYYACFYAVSALLLTKKFSTSKHGHLRSLFHREFIKTGIVTADMGRFFDLLFEHRQEGDYADFIRFQSQEVAAWMEKTEGFVHGITQVTTTIID